ncbi:MAG: EamA family transporter, partial [Chloroflexi bacterium]
MLRGAIYGLTAASIWGGMYVVSDIVLQTIPPFTLLTMRLLLGIIVLAIFVWRLPNLSLPPRRNVMRFAAVGFVGFGVSVGAQFVGTDLSNAVNGALVTSASPAFILLFAVVLLREHLTMQRLFAVILATVGVVVIVDPTQADFGEETFVGNLVLAVAAVTWGLYSVLVRRVSTPTDADESTTDTLVVTFIGFFGGLLLTIPAAALELPQNPIGDINIGIVLGVLYLGMISTAGAMWLWNRA